MKKLLLGLLILAGLAAPAAAFSQFRTVQISTNTNYTPTLQNGSINIASGTIQNLNVTGSATIPLATINASSNAVLSGTTFYQDGTIIGGTSGKPTIWKGKVTLGTTGDAVTVSSNTVLNGATFYNLGPIDMSGPTVNFNATTVANNSSYMLLYSSMVCVSASSATTSTVLVPTNSSIVITPKRTTSRIKVTANSSMKTSNGTTSGTQATLFRGSTNLATTYGNGSPTLLCYGLGAVASTEENPCSMTIWDTPGTTSSLTYAAYFASESGSATVTWNALTSLASCIMVEEWGY